MRKTKMSVTACWAFVVALCMGCMDQPSPGEQTFRLGTKKSAVATTAVGQDGTVYWTWFDSDGDRTNVYFSKLPPEVNSPTSPVSVNHMTGDANMHGQAPAQVAVGSNAEIYVAWTNRIEVEGRRFPASDLLFARSLDGGLSFSEAVTVNDDAGGMPTGHTFHDIAVAPDGVIYVSWIDTRAMDAARGDSKPVHDHDDVHMHGHHETLSGDMPGPEIRVSRSTDGGRSFHPSVVVDQTSCPCCRTSLAVSADGEVYVAWRKVYEGEIRDMAIASSVDGGESFSGARRVHVDDWHFSGCPHTGPDLAVDLSGRLHIAWYTGAADRSGLLYAVSHRDAFTEPVTLLSDTPVSQVRMAGDPQGGVWLAWEDNRSGAIRLARADNGRVEPTSRRFQGDQPALAVGPQVTSLAWNSDEGLTASVIRQ